MATTTTEDRHRWNTLHKNGPFPLKRFHKTRLEKKGNMPVKFDRYNDAATEMRRLIKEADNANEGFRSIGSKWSMSAIAHHEDNMHFGANMNIKMPLSTDDIHPDSTYDSENLFFLQSGNQIKEISLFLMDLGKSLKTTGASNGQTIAGCISTGVHGSAVDVGSVQDYVVGINLIIGPNPEDIIYLERNTKPALDDSFAVKIQSKVIRNDGLFNAVLVGLGSFGFIHGVVIEAEDNYLLHRYVRKIKKETALELARTLDFKNSEFKIPEQTDAVGNGLRPYHYKIYINQYSNEAEYPIEVIYKKPFDPQYKQKHGDPVPFMKEFIYRDLIYFFIKISETFPKVIPKFIKALSNSILPKGEKTIVGQLWEIFWDAGYSGRAFACSFGVDHKDSPKALQVLTDLTKDEGPVPGIFAMRFIKKSDALLAFSQFPVTCMIEIDGIQWEGNKKLISLEKYATRMIEVLQANNIPFTIHWGKVADWGFPNLATHMFPNNAPKWMEYRSALLSKRMAKLFSNKFLETAGLSGFDENADEDLIVSIV